MPTAIEVRDVAIYSEGTRMAGRLHIEKQNKGTRLPTLILAQGWGGTMQSLQWEGASFARAVDTAQRRPPGRSY
jgi:hypothetical protein